MENHIEAQFVDGTMKHLFSPLSNKSESRRRKLRRRRRSRHSLCVQIEEGALLILLRQNKYRKESKDCQKVSEAVVQSRHSLVFLFFILKNKAPEPLRQHQGRNG